MTGRPVRPGFDDRVGETAPQAPDPDQRWIHWCRRLNRDEQVGAIKTRVAALRGSAEALKPLLVIIPGINGSGHHCFMQRFADQDFRDIVGPNLAHSTHPLLNWPGGDSVDAVHQVITKTVTGDGAAGAIVRLAGLDKSLCFGFMVDQQRWSCDDGALVKKWVEDVEQWRPLPSGNVLIAMLGLVLAAEGTPTGRAMAGYLEELTERSQRDGSIIVTPPLERLQPTQFDEWTEWVRRRDTAFAGHLELAKLDVFGEALEPMAFEIAHNRLLKFVYAVAGHPLASYRSPA